MSIGSWLFVTSFRTVLLKMRLWMIAKGMRLHLSLHKRPISVLLILHTILQTRGMEDPLIQKDL